jgi:hypothetical protein
VQWQGQRAEGTDLRAGLEQGPQTRNDYQAVSLWWRGRRERTADEGLGSLMNGSEGGEKFPSTLGNMSLWPLPIDLGPFQIVRSAEAADGRLDALPGTPRARSVSISE